MAAPTTAFGTRPFAFILAPKTCSIGLWRNATSLGMHKVLRSAAWPVREIVLQGLQPLYHGAQLPVSRARWRPQAGTHGGTETGQQGRVSPVGFVACQFALGFALDAGRIYHADYPTVFN